MGRHGNPERTERFYDSSKSGAPIANNKHLSWQDRQKIADAKLQRLLAKAHRERATDIRTEPQTCRPITIAPAVEARSSGGFIDAG